MASQRQRWITYKNFVLKPNDAGKSDIWKTFSLVYEQNFTDNEASTEHVRFLCACRKCAAKFIVIFLITINVAEMCSKTSSFHMLILM